MKPRLTGSGRVRSTRISLNSEICTERRLTKRSDSFRLSNQVDSIALKNLEANRAIVAPGGNLSVSYQRIKRAMDIVGSIVLIVLFAPIMLATLIILTITTKGRPLYSQVRVGYLGKRIRIWKFRTMCLNADKIQANIDNEKDGPIFKNRRDPRITKIGRWLRKTSIDEMPQLFSILIGDMALVGPRPPVIPEVAQYEPWQRQRLSVQPGLTCLWQISGRSEIGFEQWVRMDIWYVRNQSLWTDLWLLFKTPLTVITGKGAY